MRTILRNLKRIEEINNKKRADYTSSPEAEYENFQRANIIASWFPDQHKSFAVLIGVKLARLGSMLTKLHTDKNYTPNNEPIDDTYLDNTTYMAIWWSYFEDVFRPGPRQPAESAGIQGANDSDELPMNLSSKLCTHTYLNEDGICIACTFKLPYNTIGADYTFNMNAKQYVRRMR